jgi:hypothetical protein
VSSKFLGGVIFCIVILAVGAFAFGVFEEASDGPLENAVEAVDDVIK